MATKKRGRPKKITGKQKSARRRNIKVAQAARKRGAGKSTRRKPVHSKEWKKRFKTEYQRFKGGGLMGRSKAESVNMALHSASGEIKSKKAIGKFEKTRSLLNKAYKRKDAGKWVTGPKAKGHDMSYAKGWSKKTMKLYDLEKRGGNLYQKYRVKSKHPGFYGR